ncbi:hypothetical protein [Microvirga terrestris]|uniref:Uncharacterized protein n=1 Tax=Microvirga terrestris TaxID=2791024 RepID=A0ABS0HVE4_9HYPH|nr:hypothetical protein [Microvirga terrestris]MBF9197464.1 hypothetical protein [Microvirga terrestris]
MRLFAFLGLASLAALATVPVTDAQAQDRPLVLRVQPRSFLDPGPVAPVGSMNRYVTAPMISSVANPPWGNQRERFEGALPDPIGGPFIGARNPFPMFGVPDVEATGSIR